VVPFQFPRRKLGGIEIRLIEAQCERLSHGEGFGYAGRFDNDGIERPIVGKFADGIQEVTTKLTADTAIIEFNQFLFLL